MALSWASAYELAISQQAMHLLTKKLHDACQ